MSLSRVSQRYENGLCGPEEFNVLGIRVIREGGGLEVFQRMPAGHPGIRCNVLNHERLVDEKLKIAAIDLLHTHPDTVGGQKAVVRGKERDGDRVVQA